MPVQCVCVCVFVFDVIYICVFLFVRCVFVGFYFSVFMFLPVHVCVVEWLCLCVSSTMRGATLDMQNKM